MVRISKTVEGNLTPATELPVVRGDDQRFVVHFGGVIVDGGCGLGAKVTQSGVEIQRADAVFTVRAGEFHAALDALDLIGLH